jgi:hypothetical protein
MIKKFCSGGDSIEARKNHKDEYQFKIQASLMICCNDMPQITPNDTKEFCEEFQMMSKFLTKEQEEREKKLPSFKYYTADDKVKEYVKQDSYINAFTNLLLDAYKTPVEYPKELKQDIIDIQEDDDYTKLLDLFTITKKTQDYITNSDLEETIKENKIPFSLQKCKMLLIKSGAKAHRTNTSRGLCNIKNKVERIIQADKIEDNKQDDLD